MMGGRTRRRWAAGIAALAALTALAAGAPGEVRAQGGPAGSAGTGVPGAAAGGWYGQRRQAAAALTALEAGEREALARTLALTEAVRQAEARLASLQEQRPAAAAAAAAARTAAGEAAQRLAGYREVTARRLRAMYRQRPASYLEVLLGATSFADLRQRWRFLTRVAGHDARLLAEFRAAAADADRTVAVRTAREQELARLEQQVGAQQAELAHRLREQEAALADLRERRSGVAVWYYLLNSVWAEEARPLLQRVVTASFAGAVRRLPRLRPDRTEWHALPPGVTVYLSADTLTRFQFAQSGLWGLEWQITPGGAAIAGELEGIPLEVYGRFMVRSETALVFAVTGVRFGDLEMPPGELAPAPVDLAGYLHGAGIAEVRHEAGRLALEIRP